MTSDFPMAGEVPAAIRAFVETTNAGDSDGFVACFTEDAFLSDWGREFRGHDGVAEWNRTDNIGQRARFELLAVRQGDTAQELIATVVVSGNGFNGTSDLTFTVRGDRIARLVIAP